MKESSYMQLAKPAILESAYKKKNQMKKKSMCDYKNCQSTKSVKSVHDDKNFQSTQCVHMQPAMKSSYMQPLTKQSHMQLPNPAMKQSTYKKFNQDDKNCQPIKKSSSEECPVRPVCSDKNYQSSKPMCYVKSEGTQSSLMWSVQ